jgi:putative redox protein
VLREVRVESVSGAGSRRQQLIQVGAHQLTADLPAAEGGADAGPSPYDLLLAALGSCTAMTVQWVADKHHLALRKVVVRLSQSRSSTGHVFRRSIGLEGELTPEQRAQLLRGAERCPVALTLKGQIDIDTRLLDETASG